MTVKGRCLGEVYPRGLSRFERNVGRAFSFLRHGKCRHCKGNGGYDGKSDGLHLGSSLENVSEQFDDSRLGPRLLQTKPSSPVVWSFRNPESGFRQAESCLI